MSQHCGDNTLFNDNFLPLFLGDKSVSPILFNVFPCFSSNKLFSQYPIIVSCIYNKTKIYLGITTENSYNNDLRSFNKQPKFFSINKPNEVKKGDFILVKKTNLNDEKAQNFLKVCHVGYFDLEKHERWFNISERSKPSAMKSVIDKAYITLNQQIKSIEVLAPFSIEMAMGMLNSEEGDDDWSSEHVLCFISLHSSDFTKKLQEDKIPNPFSVVSLRDRYKFYFLGIPIAKWKKLSSINMQNQLIQPGKCSILTDVSLMPKHAIFATASNEDNMQIVLGQFTNQDDYESCTPLPILDKYDASVKYTVRKTFQQCYAIIVNPFEKPVRVAITNATQITQIIFKIIDSSLL